MSKAKISVLAILFLLISGCPALAAESVFIIGNGTYSINGEIRKDTAPYIKNGRTYLPLRYAAYAAGIGDNSIYWDGTTKTAYMTKKGEILSVRVGERVIISGNRIIVTDAPAELMGGRVMLPLRAIAEAFGCQVEWDAEQQKAIVKE